MAKQFERPNFLRPKTKIKPSEPENFIEGSRVVVGNLTNLPKELRKKHPEGYVIKQYKNSEYSSELCSLFSEDPDLDFVSRVNSESEYIISIYAEYLVEKLGRTPSTQELLCSIGAEYKKKYNIDEEKVAKALSKFSLTNYAIKLKQRHEMLRNLFASSLPDIIVPTNYIVGSEDKEGQKGKNHIYELQQKITFTEILNDVQAISLKYTLDKIFDDKNTNYMPIHNEIVDIAIACAQNIKQRFPKKCKQIKEDLKKFIDIARKIPNNNKIIPLDLVHLSNLKFTNDGIKIIDTNLVLPVLDDKRLRNFHDIDSYLKLYYTFLDFWQIVCDKL